VRKYIGKPDFSALRSKLPDPAALWARVRRLIVAGRARRRGAAAQDSELPPPAVPDAVAPDSVPPVQDAGHAASAAGGGPASKASRARAARAKFNGNFPTPAARKAYYATANAATALKQKRSEAARKGWADRGAN